MSHPVPPQPSHADAARSDAASLPPADRPLPEFLPHVPPPGPHSPIEREIERSERASAALAATRALARAAFTDSQLAADDAAAEGDIDASGWIRTEYAALDHPVRGPGDDAAQGTGTRNLVGGSFNPGIASMQGRVFPSASLGNAPIKTRTGAEARFLHESRQRPRPERGAGTATSHAPYAKPAVMPMLAPAPAAMRAKARAIAPAHAHARGSAGEPFKFLLAAGLGAVVVLMFGGVAWKAGWLSRNNATNPALVTSRVAAQAEAARRLSEASREIVIAPAAGAAPTRTDEEVDAALAAAARAAAVPVASVHAAGPLPPVTAPVGAARVAVPAAVPTAPQRAPVPGKESVADAIAHAQARADRFLGSGGAAAAPSATADVKHGP
jgi:trimeric autotransporter adhesin